MDAYVLEGLFEILLMLIFIAVPIYGMNKSIPYFINRQYLEKLLIILDSLGLLFPIFQYFEWKLSSFYEYFSWGWYLTEDTTPLFLIIAFYVLIILYCFIVSICLSKSISSLKS